MYRAAWFRTLEEAKAYQKNEHHGALYKGTKGSVTRTDHYMAAAMFEFDPEEFPYSVNWNER